MTKIQTSSDITVKKITSMGGDHLIVAAARVSTAGEESLLRAFQSVDGQDKGLINTLMKQRHGSPFEHSALTFFVHAPICVFREWHRHRIGFSYNEESARYKQLDPLFYIPEPTRPMVPCEGFKSMRPNFRPPTEQEYNFLVNRFLISYQHSYDVYESLLGEDPKQPKFDRGLVRDVLPVGIYSSQWVTCNPRSLMSFLSLRVHDPSAVYVSYPLWEIDLAAQQVEKILAEGWPVTYQAFVDNGRVAP